MTTPGRTLWSYLWARPWRFLALGWGLVAGCSPVGCGGGNASGATTPPATTRGFDGTRAFALLQQQVDIGPRPPGSANHDKMLTWLLTEAGKVSDSVTRQDFTQMVDGVNYSLTNVLAVIHAAPGTKDPPRLMLCAHWDTRPYADEDPNPANRNKPIPGANDGASGVAVLLEMARLLKQTPPPAEIVLAFFDGEDFGNFIYGSSYFALHMGQFRPDSAILIDMIGDADLHIQQEANSRLAAPLLWAKVMSAAQDLGFAGNFDGGEMTVTDDHVPLIKQGIPAIDLIDFSYGPNNSYWHTLQDTPDKCSMESLRRVGEMLLRVVYEQ